ncbi:metallophosphoesterase [Bradyrhizobium sp. U87765 SZCCT0131]|uniref:metallophosphoesterase family protein n=1 Tax=unclassified Bradyrhizobium TaxID=2631580 RepID=UPI001BA5DFFF|nr:MULTISPECIES: metallophosphoesterase [unclassified Bradyrhizobium]MBR1217186.1 metallophosphoesterase [Bradyrhizobium sp. U87765 SZCCT0131]MBR1259058.1 metallophosphoesterase [Bradyrhizobium sp. U87765 SZCCT0134]MBR1305199.1 metallophosphoesterase [Bradyrhizobium sp. U87765 SZCCT0110]MBR1320985.1 metallophosphoesterase [Bradyrhizobium sp. U87765 SZCCT0109]MBR1350361.1 metallophosphoesterase [Bradyrhizobium sp. U87765 SZCCT0048]
MAHPAKPRTPTRSASQSTGSGTRPGATARPAIRPGEVRPRPLPKHSQAHPGVSPLHPVSHRNVSFQPLPRPLGLPPYHYDLGDNFPDIAAAIAQDKAMVFHVVGDTGGVQDGEFQSNVAEQMLAHLSSGKGPSPHFCYHVGDVVYFTGMKDDYYAQFYEPYSHYDVPIFAIPGNHDGEVDDPTAQTSLDGWVQYFMQAHPDVDPISKDAPRVQLNLPNVYWTLVTPLATIIGIYTNVPEGGSIDSVQQQWLTNEFATAPIDRALIFALHHPIYSFDVYHSGSSKMADVLENAIRDTGRVPNLVLSGHVHDYQRIEQKIAPGGPTPFIVTGNGGYHNLHAVHSAPGDRSPDTGAVLKYAAATSWGFMTLNIDQDKISGTSIEVDRTGKARAGDSFSYSAKPIILKDPKSVPTL